MKKILVFLCLAMAFALTGYANATVIISSNGFPYYGDSWDNPSDEVEAVLLGIQSDIYGDGSGDIHLNLINYGGGSITETWSAFSAQTVILEEIAGYAGSTTFGWYDLADNSKHEIFSGSDTNGAHSDIFFGGLTNFGFYIDPNASGSFMFTEHLKNTDDDYQVVIFEILEAPNTFILGWEDLDLFGREYAGDRDFQDMIVRATLNPIPEPATMLLLGSGLIGLAGIGRKKIYNKLEVAHDGQSAAR